MGAFTTHLQQHLNHKTYSVTMDQKSSTKFHLNNHWMLYSGSDFYICNNEDLRMFQKTKESTKNDVISGTSKYQVEARGTCKVCISTA
ncbi:hypothetical protein GcM3_220022 [Golovinomyces cichoracearum]|uniref:Uncharacterized protein n=1 Tax=Golovinomyces cichoracearum TaxID=62708 RepID=A0A420H7A9_9PEZI|nr:hypothetical protein GcM3_220022 [Golovinomyces cichoracearum]